MGKTDGNCEGDAVGINVCGIVGSDVGKLVGGRLGKCVGRLVSGVNTALHTVQEMLLRSPTTNVYTSSPVVC